MCGICGVLTFREYSRREDLLAPVVHMTSLMARRGPDDQGIWADGHCAFGFRRLSILDLSSTGHQPMATADGRFVLVFNGELYNFRDFRPQLEQRGVRFRSTGDAEVVLYALAEWGVEALHRFNGMFALGFYDTVAGTLLLARDHAGIKPLYYLRHRDGVVFGSQYNQLLSHPGSHRLSVSNDALALYLRLGFVPAPYAMLEQTYHLEPGCWLQADKHGNIRQGCFYEFPLFREPDLEGEEAVDAVEEALARAVSRHLISDVPVGVFLSGGIDSPLVAAEARRQGGKLKAFTIGFPGWKGDEAQDAARYASELGLEHMPRSVDEQTAWRLLDDVIAAATEPTADYSMFPTLMVSKLARESVKVVLSGDGGDELFWGYPSRFGSVMAQRHYYDYPMPARYAMIALRRVGVGCATRDALFPSIGQLYQKKLSIAAGDELLEVFPGLRQGLDTEGFFCFHETDAQQTAQWIRWVEFRLHLTRVLLKVDRASMYHSLEVRVPLLDREVIDVATRIDWRSCLDVNRSCGKIPLRRALARRLKHQTEHKKGFGVPIDRWLAGPLQSLLQEKVLSRSAILGQPLNQRRLRQMNQRLLQGHQSAGWPLWALLSLALWDEAHLAPSRSSSTGVPRV